MNIKIIFLAITTLSLVACRADLSERDTDPQTSRSLDRPMPTETPRTSAPADAAVTDTAPPPTSSGSYLAGDGPGADTPANLENTPDAVPRAEPLHRYANRPYAVLGKNYTPLSKTGAYKERGIASWYGKKFHGEKTSIGEIYDMYGMTAAHTTLPIPSYAKVTNLENNKSVIVRINDRGPFLHDRIIDLSYTAATKLGLIGKGQGMVEVESLSTDNAPIYKEPLQVAALPPPPASTPTPIPSAGNVYLQLGAFSSQQGAESFLNTMKSKLGDTGKQLSLFHKDNLVKVRIGPYADKDKARAVAQELQSRLGFKPMVTLK